VCEASVNAKNEVKVHRVVIGIDPGYAVNPPTSSWPNSKAAWCTGLTAIFLGREYHQGRPCGAIRFPRLPHDAFERDAQSGNWSLHPPASGFWAASASLPKRLWHPPAGQPPLCSQWVNAFVHCP
jgi:hypothetical protein